MDWLKGIIVHPIYCRIMFRKKRILWAAGGVVLVMILGALVVIGQTRGRTQIQINIHQNREAILLSTFAEPPQFAIWLENKKNHKKQTVFVTHRAGADDWEGKVAVPVALPRWYELFKVEKQGRQAKEEEELISAITGATPKDDYFSVRAEVKPGSEWICWIEMNLAGDYNEAYPQQKIESFEVDEFSNGQPALLFRGEVLAEEGSICKVQLVSQSIWDDGNVRIEPVGDGVVSAKNIFDEISLEIIQPKPKLIEKHKISEDKTHKPFSDEKK